MIVRQLNLHDLEPDMMHKLNEINKLTNEKMSHSLKL